MLGSKRDGEGRDAGWRFYETPFTKLPNSRGAESSPFSEGPLGSLLTESPWGGSGKGGRMVSRNSGKASLTILVLWHLAPQRLVP